jgi:hypothetical protein
VKFRDADVQLRLHLRGERAPRRHGFRSRCGALYPAAGTAHKRLAQPAKGEATSTLGKGSNCCSPQAESMQELTVVNEKIRVLRVESNKVNTPGQFPVYARLQRQLSSEIKKQEHLSSVAALLFVLLHSN